MRAIMNYQKFKNKWEELDQLAYGYLKLPMEHPIDFEMGYCGNRKKSLIVMDTGVIKDIPCSYAIRAVNRELVNHKWALELQLLQEDYEEEFLCLCWDIIQCSNTIEQPMQKLIERYLSWQKLLQYVNREVMSFSRQKGLIGELLFLKNKIDVNGIKQVINAWVGPDGADQDFSFPDTWYEVKTVSLAAETVKISSFEQLYQDREGELVVICLETSTPGDDKIMLSRLVSYIRELLVEEPELFDIFNLKLFKYGFRDRDISEYDKNCFRYIDQKDYKVDEKFPRLTRANVPRQIVSGTYSISLASIEEHRRR